MRKLFSDLLILCGCSLIVYGAWLVHPLAAIFTGGVMLVALGAVIGLEERK